MILTLDHIAILVRSLTEVASVLAQNLEQLPVESFPEEGTKEQYIDLTPDGALSLLLVEATADGPYQRALEKRGPGLHHFGCCTNDLEEAIRYFSQKALLLHPISLQTHAKGTVWFCRPGVPFLIELSQRENLAPPADVAVSARIPKLNGEIEWVPSIQLQPSQDDNLHLLVNSNSISLKADC